MKKFFLVAIILLSLAVMGLSFFILTFDMDEHRPYIVSKLEEATGSRVRMESISLGWKGGLVVTISGLSLQDREASWENPQGLFLTRAYARLLFWPMLRQNFKVGEITLEKPSLSLLLRQDGSVVVEGLSALMNQQVESEASSGTLAISFLISRIMLNNGRVRFRDLADPSYQLEASDIDIELHDVSLIRPWKFEIAMNVLGVRQNLFATGKFKLPGLNRPAMLEDLEVQTELVDLDLAGIAAIHPELKSIGEIKSVKGSLVLKADALKLDETIQDQWQAHVTLKSGELELANYAPEFTAISIESELRSNNVNVKQIGFDLGGGFMAGTASLQILEMNQKVTLSMIGRQFDLSRLIPRTDLKAPYWQGILNSDLNASCLGDSLATCLPNLNGQMKVNIERPVIGNLNLLNEVFNRISVLPSLREKVLARLSPEYQKQLELTDTRLHPIEMNLISKGGALTMDKLVLASDQFEAEGALKIDWEGNIDFQAVLRLDQELTKAMLRSVKELEYLVASDGRLEFPVRFRGSIDNFRPFPDVGYIASKIAVSKTQDLLGGLLDKKSVRTALQGNENNTTTTAVKDSSSSNQNILLPTLESLISEFIGEKK